MSEIEIGNCNWCGKPKGGEIEVWTPDGAFHGCCCEQCYHSVHSRIEQWYYHGGEYPEPQYED